MVSNKSRTVAAVVCACAIVGGCGDLFKSKSAGPQEKSEKVPLHVSGTIAEQALLIGGGEIAMQGYGIVVGLGNDGSSEVPPVVRKYLVKQLLKEGLGSWRGETEQFDPNEILRDKDTAVVLIGGAIPPGAPVGTHFDVFVTALRQTSTRSLAGGVLMPADMHLSLRGIAQPGGRTQSWARAGGSVLVNPFLDPTNPSEAPKLREGRIPGGGVVTKPRPIQLQLRQPDYAMSQSIQRRINAKYEGVASAKNRSVVELTVPRQYARDYERFLKLVMHLPLRAGTGSDEARAVQIVAALESPDANHDELALVLEAMGRQLQPIFSKLYTSKNDKAAFYAARTGLRLGDWKASEVLIQFAATDGSPLQVPAIQELGDYPKLVRGIMAVRKLVDNGNESVRIAACEALAKLGDTDTVRCTRVGDQFDLDVVKSSGPNVIYARQTGEQKIVIFGSELAVKSPVFFTMPEDLVTLNAHEGDKKLVVFRKIPRTGRMTPGLGVDFGVRSLVELLGSPPARDAGGEVRGLNLTYGQVLGVLYRLCKNKDIPAKFVLQPLPDLQRIYRASEPSEEEIAS